MDFFFFFSRGVALFILPEMWYLAFLLCSWPMIKTIKLDCHLRGVIIRWVHCSLPQDYIIFYTVPNLHQLLFIGQLIILGWTSFKIASILHEIDRTRCSKHSSKVNIDVMLRICYRLQLHILGINSLFHHIPKVLLLFLLLRNQLKQGNECLKLNFRAVITRWAHSL